MIFSVLKMSWVGLKCVIVVSFDHAYLVSVLIWVQTVCKSYNHHDKSRRSAGFALRCAIMIIHVVCSAMWLSMSSMVSGCH